MKPHDMDTCLDNLRERGFDKSYRDRERGGWTIVCSQCKALVINGVACHENGCPNKPRPETMNYEED